MNNAKKQEPKTFIDRLIEEMPENLTDFEKARYIYIELGKYFSYDEQYIISDKEGKEEYLNKSIEYIKNDKTICKLFAKLYEELLNKVGVKAKVIKTENGEFVHFYTEFEIDGKMYHTDLTYDLMRIKTGMQTNNFADDRNNTKYSYLSPEELKKIDNKIGYTYNRNVYG